MWRLDNRRTLGRHHVSHRNFDSLGLRDARDVLDSSKSTQSVVYERCLADN